MGTVWRVRKKLSRKELGTIWSEEEIVKIDEEEIVEIDSWRSSLFCWMNLLEHYGIRIE